MKTWPCSSKPSNPVSLPPCSSTAATSSAGKAIRPPAKRPTAPRRPHSSRSSPARRSCFTMPPGNRSPASRSARTPPGHHGQHQRRHRHQPPAQRPPDRFRRRRRQRRERRHPHAVLRSKASPPIPWARSHGDIGKIIAGGAVTNVNVNGSLSGVSGRRHLPPRRPGGVVTVGTVDYNTVPARSPEHLHALDKSNAKSGSKANIGNIIVTTADQLEIFAGSGYNNTSSKGGIGGSIAAATITETLSGKAATRPLPARGRRRHRHRRRPGRRDHQLRRQGVHRLRRTPDRQRRRGQRRPRRRGWFAAKFRHQDQFAALRPSSVTAATASPAARAAASPR